MLFHKGFGPRYDRRAILLLRKRLNIYHRICIGRHIASLSLFINIASILWAVNIDSVKDEAGKPIIPDSLETMGVIMWASSISLLMMWVRFGLLSSLVLDDLCRSIA